VNLCPNQPLRSKVIIRDHVKGWPNSAVLGGGYVPAEDAPRSGAFAAAMATARLARPVVGPDAAIRVLCALGLAVCRPGHLTADQTGVQRVLNARAVGAADLPEAMIVAMGGTVDRDTNAPLAVDASRRMLWIAEMVEVVTPEMFVLTPAA